VPLSELFNNFKHEFCKRAINPAAVEKIFIA